MFERWSRLWMVKCGACGVLLDPDERSQEACIKEWNRRHTTPEIAAMMSKHVENWPEHKKLSTSIALIDKTIAAALEVHQLAEDQDVAIVLLEALTDAIEAGSDAIFLPREKAVQLTVEAFARHRLQTEARMSAAVEADVEKVARIIDPSSWAVMDGYLSDMLRKYKGQKIGYDPDAFKHKPSMKIAEKVIAAIRSQSNG